jgi:ATP-dependent DNA helicase RecQ
VASEPVDRAAQPSFIRLVAVDLETVLRFTGERPEGERTIFQVGAVRFGLDAEWSSSPSFDRYLSLPAELRERLVKPELREAVEVLGEEPAVVLQELIEYLDGADAIVAYNGRSFDFPLLDDAIAKHLQSKISPRIRRIDGLYVAVSVWPVPPRAHKLSHLITSERLAAIRERLEIDLTGLQAHKAADDSRMLAELMRFAAAEVGDWSPELRSLVRSVGHASDAWSMLFSLGATAPSPRAYDMAEVREVLALSLGGKEPLRREAKVGSGTIDLTPIAGAGGVDIDRLVRLVKGENASVRDSQRHMVEAMRDWIAQGFDALVEAPTGTGKSYAILAVALDWLAADSRNRVVLSTFTRQLQSQLANDIFELHERGGAPGLIEITSLVKGAANRLSLAGLVRTLSDSTLPPPRGHRRRGEFAGDPLLAELALYLALRLRGRRTASTRLTSNPSSTDTSEPPEGAHFAAGS